MQSALRSDSTGRLPEYRWRKGKDPGRPDDRICRGRGLSRIGKASCTLPEAQVYLTNTKNQYESVYGPGIWETASQDETLEDRVKDTVIARIAQIKTMNLLAAEYNITLTKDEQATVDQAGRLSISRP